MMDWQTIQRIAEQDGRASQAFLEWLQQLAARIDALEARNIELEERIAALEP